MKGKEPTSINKEMNFMMLPNDLVLNCLARVSRLYYPTLSLVCKSFRSLVASPELYETRTLLGRTESILYMCLLVSFDPNPHVFILYPRPILNPKPNPKPKPKPRWFIPNFLTNHTREKKKKDSVESLLIPCAGSSSVFPGVGGFSRFVAVGSNIYQIGSNTTKFSFLDCTSHTWHEVPNMLSAYLCPLLGVLDGKIYVIEGTKLQTDSVCNSVQCFDPKTQVWEYLQVPVEWTYKNKSFAMEGKLYVHRELSQHLVYDQKEKRWVEDEFDVSWPATCVIDDVYYSFTKGKLYWYDSEGRSWRDLNGLEGWLSEVYLSSASVKLTDYGGKMALLWGRRETDGCKIRCAEIALERRNGHEMWGKVEWYGLVLELPMFTLYRDVVVVGTV